MRGFSKFYWNAATSAGTPLRLIARRRLQDKQNKLISALTFAKPSVKNSSAQAGLTHLNLFANKNKSAIFSPQKAYGKSPALFFV
jgi:hypothetical protein